MSNETYPKKVPYKYKYSEGLEIGAVSVKWLRIAQDGAILKEIVRHEGYPREKISQIFERYNSNGDSSVVITGSVARNFYDFSYYSEAECFEKALAYYNIKPDLLLSLGGETFSVYPMKNGVVKNIISSSKCAAGTGEFIVQQLERMGLSLKQGIKESSKGQIVQLATRCSVHCKSDATTLNYGKKICSGRECLPSLAIAGAVLKDIQEHREENEITIYTTPIDQHGPCQNGAWPVLWETFAKRLNLKNVLFYQTPNNHNGYLGLNKDFIAQEKLNFVIGQYIIEARNALRCTAEDQYSALNEFEEITDKFVESVRVKEKTIKTGLLRWAKEVAKIPLKTEVEETTKILIFGGLNLMFDHYPIEEFFLEKGIITKVSDLAEAMTLLLSEKIIKFGLKKGLVTPKEQFNESLINYSELNLQEQKEASKAKRSRNMINFLDSQCKMYRRIMGKSGLLFDSYVEIDKLLEEGHKHASANSMTETPQIVGRFLYSIKEKIFDGLINLGTFNCQPAMNSQAIIRPLANKSEVPYAAIDCEGPWISSNQKRLLETIAVQAVRLRKKKNG